MQLNTDYLSKKSQNNKEQEEIPKELRPDIIFGDEQLEEKKRIQRRRAVKS